MKNLIKLSALAAVLVASCGIASADTLTLGSFGSTAGYNPGTITVDNTAMNFAGFNASSDTPSTGTGTSYALNPSNVWNAAIPNSAWVGSTMTSGPASTVNTALNPALGFYTYTTSFTAGMPFYSGTLSVMADDTTAVYLNGSMLIMAGALGGNSHCADNAPTCLITDTISLHGVAMNSGMDANTLTFVVQQAGNLQFSDPTGVDFSASLTSVPEPSTLMMLGTGLLGSAGAIFRRMRS